jgi:hypothetical protein
VDAIFFPGVQRPSQEELEQEETESYTSTLQRNLVEALKTPVGGLALNLDWHYGTQTLLSSIPAAGLHFSSQSRVDTYSIRPEIVWTNWLSTYAIAGIHQGTNTAPAFNLNLDGWAAGVGTTLALGLPPKAFPNLVWLPAFIVPDFNWTHNEFQDVNNAVNIFNLTIRAGTAIKTGIYNWGFYGGPMYEALTEDLSVRTTMFGNVNVHSAPENAWSGVIGTYVGLRIANEHPEDLPRPTVLLSIEGGVGNRESVLVSLRYEFDFLTRS